MTPPRRRAILPTDKCNNRCYIYSPAECRRKKSAAETKDGKSSGIRSGRPDAAERYLRLLSETIHSAVAATADADGRSETRAVDVMLADADGVYFLTARGKTFYRRLTEQGYLALTAVKDGESVSVRGKVRCIGKERLDEIFEKNPYMGGIYPGATRDAMEVFVLYEGRGEYFDIRVPSRVRRDFFPVERGEMRPGGWLIGDGCTGCGRCLSVCPQRCISLSAGRAAIDPRRCLSCGECGKICPEGAAKRRDD